MTQLDHPIRILVVDDDDVDRMAVRRALVRGGVKGEVDEATDFNSAKAALLSKEFDCALLDYAFPGGDGLDLLREVKAASVETPIIMLTGHGDEALAVTLMKSGAGDYLAKSALTPELLVQSVRRVLRVRDADRRARAAHVALARQARQLLELARVSVSLHAAHSAEEAVELVVCDALPMFSAKTVILTAAPKEDGNAPLVCACDDGQLQAQASPAFATAIATIAALDFARTLRLTANAEGPIGDEVRALGIETLLACRLVDRGGNALGCIALVGSSHGGFETSDEAVLVQLAQTTSVAIENARLYRATEEAKQARDTVLEIVSHDLRNPLNFVSMSASLLRQDLEQRETDTSREMSLVARIERGASRMNRLIEDLLDATRIDAKNLSMTLAVESGASMVHEAAEAAQSLAEGQGSRIEIGAVDETLSVRADHFRILQVFSNLTGNAMKFSPKGGVITLRLLKTSEGACFEVEDQGPGIDAQHVPKLFERYWRADGQTREGAGLGLYICRGILEAQGGHIAAESVVGRGTTIRFWLPVV